MTKLENVKLVQVWKQDKRYCKMCEEIYMEEIMHITVSDYEKLNSPVG